MCGAPDEARPHRPPHSPPPRACPGGASSPCNHRGTCMDGMSGSGECRCHARFTGTACELCAPGAFGPLCQGRLCCPARPGPLTALARAPTPPFLSLPLACNCTSRGRCDEGLGGSGSCFCEEGWTGPRCEVQLGEWPCAHAHPAHTSACPNCSHGWEGVQESSH